MPTQQAGAGLEPGRAVKMSTDDQIRKRERDQLFQSLHQALPDDEKSRLKEYAKRTLQDKPPTMGKPEVIMLMVQTSYQTFFLTEFGAQFMRHVLEMAEKFQPELAPGFRRHFSPHLGNILINAHVPTCS